MKRKTTLMIMVIIAISLLINMKANDIRDSSILLLKIHSSTSSIPQNYTSVSRVDPLVTLVNQTATIQLLRDIMHDTIRGTNTSWDGAFKIPNIMPASLLVTRDVVEAYKSMDDELRRRGEETGVLKNPITNQMHGEATRVA